MTNRETTNVAHSKPPFTLWKAKQYLAGADRYVDEYPSGRPSGDIEYYWFKDGIIVAVGQYLLKGYYDVTWVTVLETPGIAETTFGGNPGGQLFSCYHRELREILDELYDAQAEAEQYAAHYGND